MNFKQGASIVQELVVGIGCALPKRHVVVRVGDLNAVTLNCGVTCRHNSTYKLVINYLMWKKKQLACSSVSGFHFVMALGEELSFSGKGSDLLQASPATDTKIARAKRYGPPPAEVNYQRIKQGH